MACAGAPATLAARLGWLTQHRAQLLAEAVAAFRAGEIWYLDRDVGQAAEQERRREVDPLEASVRAVVEDLDEVDMRQLRADHRVARDLPASAVSQAKLCARILRSVGFGPPVGHHTIWKRRRGG